MIKLLKYSLTLIFTFQSISISFAQVPRSAISKAEFVIYGIYTSADPTCQSGLVATLPLTASGRVIDFSKNAAIGKPSGFSTEINCIAIVIKSGIDITVSAGNYGAGNPCNPGTSSADDDYQVSNGANITWPAKITSDAAAVGLTLMTSGSSNSNSVVPIYLSTNSICSTQDVGVGCNTFPEGFRYPTSASNTAHGFKLDPITPDKSYKFVFDLENVLGDSGSGCGIAAPPIITFEPI
jgi:hypothetical protein